MILGVSLNAKDTISRKKWDKLSDDQKFETVQQLYTITEEMENQRDEYQGLLSNEMKINKKRKPKMGGFSVGMDAGFLYNNTNLSFDPTMGIIVNGHIVMWNTFILSPGINVNFYRSPGLKLNLTVGWLF
jgi:hypothetical protein